MWLVKHLKAFLDWRCMLQQVREYFQASEDLVGLEIQFHYITTLMHRGLLYVSPFPNPCIACDESGDCAVST